MSSLRPRSTRDRPAKVPLSLELIVDTALGILRAEGLDAVTMRRVAAELDTGPASLYVYIRGSRELGQAMLDRVAAGLPLEEPDPSRWREQVLTLLTALLDALEAHPGIARVALANVPTSPQSLHFAEALFGMLRAGGIDAQGAAWACDILPLIVTASAIETVTYQEREGTPEEESPEEVVARIRAAFAGLPPDRFPLLVANAEHLTSGDGRQRFAFAIETFLDGLLARSGSAAT